MCLAGAYRTARSDSFLARLTKSLKPNGVLYVSFKHGDSKRMENGRFLNDLNETLLKTALASHLSGSWSESGSRKTIGIIAEAAKFG